MNYKYHIFDKLLHVSSDKMNISISNDSENFDLIKSALLQNDFNLVQNLIESENSLNLKQLNCNKGIYSFKGKQLPTTIADFYSKEKNKAIPYLNFWINKVARNESIDKNTLLNLFSGKIAPIDSSGFLFASKCSIDGNEFIDASNLDNESFESLQKNNGIQGILEKYFSNSSKKLLSSAKKQLIKNGKLDNKFIKSLEFIKQYSPNADNSTLINLVESNLLNCLNESLADINVVANLFSQVFTSHRILNILEEKNQVNELKHNFSNIANCWRQLQGKISINKKFNDFSDLISWLSKESETERNADCELNQELNHPFTKSITGKLGNYDLKVAKTKYEILEWKSELGNCLANYIDRVIDGQTIIFGLLQNEKIKYAIEIDANKSIKQFEGKAKSKPSSSLKSQVKQFLNEIE